VPFAAAAAVASAGIAAYSSSQQSKAVKKGQDAAIAAQQQAEAQAREDLSPWRTQGENALMMTGSLAGLNGKEAQTAAFGDFQADPGYQFGVSEGLRAVDTGAAARGLLRSGATLRAEQTLGTNLANQQFGQYWNRLIGMSQQGLTAAGGQASASQSTGKGIAQTETDAATAQSQILGQEGQNYQQLIKNLYAANGGSGSMYGSQTNALFGGGSDVNGTNYTYNAPAGGFAGGYPAQGFANQNVVDTGNYPTSGLRY